MIVKNHVSRIEFKDPGVARCLYGVHDEHLRIIERCLGVRVGARGGRVTIEGEFISVELARKLLHETYQVMQKGHTLYPSDFEYAVRILKKDKAARLEDIFLDVIHIASPNKVVTPKSVTQKAYVDAIRRHDIVFAIGPAGTGKTYLAMAMAVSALTRKEVRRIILTRPAVEAGEKLGFLPGDLYEKVNPYLRPLYDALHDMMDLEQALKLVNTGVIEVAPLAFMRGRTLNDSYVILDEAQNTTSEQMKMFLTRLGASSKAVITGDVTQVDLPEDRISGLVEIQGVLQGIDEIAFVYLSETDVVRHRLVIDIITAYERREARRDQAGCGNASAPGGKEQP